jgi:hypothetical protein
MLKPTLPLKDATFSQFKKAVAASRKDMRDRAKLWQKNIDNTYGELPRDWDDGAVQVNKDYPRSRQLISQLFFRTPEVQAKPLRPGSAEMAPIAAAAINQKTREIGVSYVVDEVLTDVIIPAGIGAAFIDYEAIKQKVTVPSPQFQGTPMPVVEGLEESGVEGATVEVEIPSYEAYVFRRIAPDALVTPADFDGSRWDDASFVGEAFTIPSAEATRLYKLTKEELEKVSGKKQETMTGEEAPEASYDKVTGFTLFYRACFYDATAPHKDLIRKLVYFDGLDKPVVHEDYHGQRYEGGQLYGVRKYPIRPLTKVFVPGRPIPPSDVTITRPQVAELSKGRTFQMLQRERSLPIRWLDVNQCDEETESLLLSGQVQSFIPFNGPGGNAIGEIARANFPRESFELDRVIEHEVADAWGLQMPQSQSGEQTAEEVRESAVASNTRLDYDRTKVLRWFIECVEVLFGLMQLYADVTDYAELVGPDGAQQLVAWNKENLRGHFALEARPDAALRLDAAADRQQALNLFQLLGNDPFIDRRALLQEVLRTHNLNDGKVLLPQPPEPQPEKPNISFRFDADALDPTRPHSLLVYDILAQTGLKLDPALVQQARDLATKMLMLAAQNPLLGLADTTRVDIRTDPAGATGQPSAQPPNPGAVTQVEPLNKTQLTEGRMK